MVRVRIAPSPTGFLHVGTIRTALYNYLFARKYGGTYLLRLEDTDAARNHPDFERSILEGLASIGLGADEGLVWENGAIAEKGTKGPYRQSARTTSYAARLQELADRGAIYPAYETKEELEAQRAAQQAAKLPPRYDGAHRNLTPEQRAAYEVEERTPVWRLRVDESASITFDDLIHGPQRVAAKEIGDIIIARSLTDPLYNFAVVVDDVEMEITHVIRGDDHLSNTSKQVLLYEALGAPLPIFAHVPLMLNADRSKMSKRKGETRFDAYVERGFLPEALLNFLALTGWNAGDDREIYTLQELEQAFSLERVSKSGGVFDMTKLEWMNGEYLKKLDLVALRDLAATYAAKANVAIEPADRFQRAVQITRDRYHVLSDAPTSVACYMTTPSIADPALLWGKQTTREQAEASLAAAIPALEVHADWTVESLLARLFTLVAELGVKNGDVLWPVRVALTGLEKSPGPAESAWVLGKDECAARLRLALSLLKKAH